MRGGTHALVGGAAAVGLVALTGTDNLAAAFVVGVGVGLLPNVDKVAPWLAARGGQGWLGKLARALGDVDGDGREFTHSLWLFGGLALLLLVTALLGLVQGWAAWAAGGAYLSHILGDMWAKWGGVKILAPYGEAVYFPPWSRLRLNRSGLGEILVMISAGFVGIWALAPWLVARLILLVEGL